MIILKQEDKANWPLDSVNHSADQRLKCSSRPFIEENQVAAAVGAFIISELRAREGELSAFSLGRLFGVQPTDNNVTCIATRKQRP
jgi:hypothetical protein